MSLFSPNCLVCVIESWNTGEYGSLYLKWSNLYYFVSFNPWNWWNKNSMKKGIWIFHWSWFKTYPSTPHRNLSSGTIFRRFEICQNILTCKNKKKHFNKTHSGQHQGWLKTTSKIHKLEKKNYKTSMNWTTYKEYETLEMASKSFKLKTSTYTVTVTKQNLPYKKIYS